MQPLYSFPIVFIYSPLNRMYLGSIFGNSNAIVHYVCILCNLLLYVCVTSSYNIKSTLQCNIKGGVS